MANKRIYIPEYNASASVSENCSPETVQAVKELCRLASHGLKKPNVKPEKQNACIHVPVRRYGVLVCKNCGQKLSNDHGV